MVVFIGVIVERINFKRIRFMLFVRDQNMKEGGGGEGLVYYSFVCSEGDEKVCIVGLCVIWKFDRRL